MLFVQGRRRNEGSYPPSLFESAYFVVVDFCSIQCIMGDALFSERDVLELGGFFVDKKKKKVWKVAPLCLFWSIWREENRRAFENCASLDQTIKSSILYLFWDWVRLYIGDGFMLLIDFVDWLGSS